MNSILFLLSVVMSFDELVGTVATSSIIQYP